MTEESEKKDLVRIAETEGLMALLMATVENADSIGTGILGTEKLALFMLPGRLVQAARNRTFLRQLAHEFEDLRKKGSIKTDYMQSEQGKACLQELLAALEVPPVDESRFQLLKRLFLRAATETLSTRDDVLPQMLMEIAKDLSAGEAMVLAAEHRKIGREKPSHVSAHEWIQSIVTASPIRVSEMVNIYEERLIQKKLLTDRAFADRSGVSLGANFRLTDLGVTLCQFLAEEEKA